MQIYNAMSLTFDFVISTTLSAIIIEHLKFSIYKLLSGVIHHIYPIRTVEEKNKQKKKTCQTGFYCKILLIIFIMHKVQYKIMGL